MLHGGHDAIAHRSEIEDQLLRVAVVSHSDGEINIAREPHLTTHGHGQATYERVGVATFTEMRCDLR